MSIKTTTEPVRTTAWVDFTTRAIRIAIIKMKPAYITLQESLAEKRDVSSECCYSFMGSANDLRSSSLSKSTGNTTANTSENFSAHEVHILQSHQV